MSDCIVHTTREIWKPVVGYEGWYSVSNRGRVKRIARGRSTRRGRLRVGTPDRDGYLRLVLNRYAVRTGFYVHQLVACAFIGPCPAGMEVDHIDRDVTNNRVENLRYVTHAENLSRRMWRRAC
jgi:hypothetical protein